jgi:transcriptional regulator with XRE-family HTH domain
MALRVLLAELRRRSGMGVPDVATAVGVGDSTAYSWETDGKNAKRPEPRHLAALLRLYDATPDEERDAWRALAAPRDATATEAA